MVNIWKAMYQVVWNWDLKSDNLGLGSYKYVTVPSCSIFLFFGCVNSKYSMLHSIAFTVKHFSALLSDTQEDIGNTETKSSVRHSTQSNICREWKDWELLPTSVWLELCMLLSAFNIFLTWKIDPFKNKQMGPAVWPIS